MKQNTIVFFCVGTGGHVLPVINLIDDLHQKGIEKRKIKVQDHYLQPGDELYIRARVYHRVESNESSIIIGHAPTLKCTKRCQDKFNKIWPKQGKICKNNRCLD